MTAAALIAAAVLTSLLLASAARLPSLASTLLVAYLAYVGNLGVTTLALSPLHEVTRGGLAVAEGVLLAAALALWWLRGRPRPPLGAAGTAVRELLADPPTALFLVAVLVLLAYEVALAAGPPNNMDSLTYHLARAAAWAQHGGIFWIPNVLEVELNAYQPLAEQQNLFLLVATGGGALYALPQFLAELSILTAVYGSARRLGFEVRAAACAAFLLATFSLVALEAVTAQNDLFAASFAAVAVCLLLGDSRLEHALAGVSAAFGLGTKLTSALIVPVLAWLALARGRRVFATAVAGGLAGLAAVGMWGYVLNLVHTGHLLGTGTGAVQDRGSPSYPGSVANAFYLLYGTMDVSVLSNRLIDILAVAGLLAGGGAAAWALRRGRRRPSIREGALVALPFLAPLLVLAGAALFSFVAGVWGFPIRGSHGIVDPLDVILNETYTRISNEDYSAYGPVGIVALFAAGALTIYSYATRRTDVRQLVLASAFPVFLVLISLESTWVPFLIRFFLFPAVVAAPLLARLLHGRSARAAFFVVAALTVGLTITHDQPKPLDNPYGYGRPWHLTEVNALWTDSHIFASAALAEYQKLIPPHACVGAAIDANEPSYLLYGPHLQHHVVYLPVSTDALLQAVAHDLFYVVVDTNVGAGAADAFQSAGWRLHTLNGPWSLAVAPRAGTGDCSGQLGAGSSQALETPAAAAAEANAVRSNTSSAGGAVTETAVP